MIENLSPYPEYKDSVLPWVERSPAHWKLTPNRGLIKKRKIFVGEKHPEYELLSLTKQGVIVRDTSTGKGKFSSDMGTSQEVRPGDLIFCLFDVPETPRTVGLSRHAGMITGAYTVFEPIGSCSAEYFERFYIAMDDRKLLSPLYSGLRNTIPPSRFLATKTPVPPPEEQAAIVKFLDHADRRIRRYIQAKRKLIALLNEQKQAIIHRAVTRGIDPNVKLKPSDNSWFPEIPVHWNVLPMRRVIRNAIDGPHHSPNYIDDGVPFLSARNIKEDSWCLDDAKYISEADYMEYCKRVTPEPGDVLYTKGGTTGVARAVDLSFPFQVWVHVAVLKINKGMVTPRFLASALNTPRCYEQSQLFTRGATNQDLGLGRMKRILLPVPPLAEQDSIVEVAQRESSLLLSAIQNAAKEIELLREIRTRLIADIVTGKLDVREAAAALPEELESDETEVDELLDEDEIMDDIELDLEEEEIEA